MDADFKLVTLRVAVVDVVILGYMSLYSSAAQKFPEATLTQKQNWLPQTCHRIIIQLMHKRALSLSLPGLLQERPRGKTSKAVHCMLDLYANHLLIQAWLLGDRQQKMEQWKVPKYPAHSKGLLYKSP